MHRWSYNLVGQGRLTTKLTISISVIRGARKMRSTVHVTKLFSILLNVSTKKRMKQKKIVFLAPVITDVEMVSTVVKRPLPTRSTVHVTELFSISLNFSTQKKRMKQKK